MIRKLFVIADKKKVGTLALTNDNRVAFQYDNEWIENGFSLNPFKLPLNKTVFIAKITYFRGLFGVFADSLPDSYGELLLDRFLKKKGIDISTLTCLDRLAYVGSSGMGILEYVPDYSEQKTNDIIDFDEIQKECDDLLDSKPVSDIENLFSMGGSSGGARPKSLITYNGREVIVKFSSKFDPKNIAELEYKYMQLAGQAGIEVPPTKLITSKSGKKYYIINRFDRDNGKKIHMISVAALLECDFRQPCLDYNDLIKLTAVLTRDDKQVVEMYRRMVFNVVFHNQDDHAKNFSFIYDNTRRMYKLAPAYDITPSTTYYAEHTTSVNGKGKDITDDDLLAVATNNHIDASIAKKIISEIKALKRKE